MYQKKELSYSLDALEPWMSKLTLYYQNKFYLKAVHKLNQLLLVDRPLEQVVQKIDDYPLEKRGDILFLSGRILNHELYFDSMSPKRKNQPVGKLKQAINQQYGSYSQFLKEFKKVSHTLVGSGYTFVVVDKNNRLNIINMPNEETPYLYGFTPIMALDLWEHSYFLTYQDRIDEYIDAFFEVIDYEKINKRYEKIIL